MALKPPTKHTRMIGIYQIMQEVGKGATSTVHIAKNTVNNEIVCAKIMEKQSLASEENMKFFRKEIGIMSSINHPNIVKYYELLEDVNYYYVIMEYCQGESLQKIINRPGRLSETYIANIFRQLMQALQYLHETGIAHRDLKPDNIIVGPKSKIKLVDFGLSTDNASNLRLTYCGSLAFAAPECIQREPYLAPLADIWSAGVILYMMAVGQLPWPTSNLVQMMKNITSGKFIIPLYLSKGIHDLLSRMLRLNPSERPTSSQVLQCEWLKQDWSKPKPPPSYDNSSDSSAQSSAPNSARYSQRRNSTRVNAPRPILIHRVKSDPLFCVTPPPNVPSSGSPGKVSNARRIQTSRGIRSRSVDRFDLSKGNNDNASSILVGFQN